MQDRKCQNIMALYDAVDARYSSPAIAALGRLLLSYLFPDLSSFATVEDLVSHVRASDARYRAAVPAEFLDKNQLPVFITLYFILTLSLDPTSLTVDLLEQHLLPAKTSAVAVGAARGTPRPPFFEGCSPSPLAPSYASTAAADVSVAEDVGADLLVRSAAAARARVARVVEVAAVVVEVVAGVVVGTTVEVVAAVGLQEGVGSLVAVVEAAVGVATVAAVGLVEVGLALGVVVLEVASVSSSSVGARPHHDKLSPRDIPCVFLGFVPDAPGWQFYHPTSRRVFPSQDVTFDESVPIYRLFLYRSAPPPPPLHFLAPGPTPVDPLPHLGRAPSSVSQVDPHPGATPVQGAETGVVEPGGVETGGAEPRVFEAGGAEPEGVEPEGATSEGAESGAAEPQGASLSGGSAATGAGGAGAAGAGGAGVAAEAGVTGGTAATGPGGARTRGTRAAATGGVDCVGARHPTESGAIGTGGSGTGGAGAGGAGVGGTGARGAGVGGPSVGGAGAGGAGVVDPGVFYRPYSSPLVPDLESDRAHATSPSASRLLHTAVTDPLFESTAASSLVAELLDFAVACRLDYTTALVADFASASPPSVGGECAFGTDVLEERQEDFKCLAAPVPRFASMLLAPKGHPDAPDIPTPRSYTEAITGTYIDEVPPPWANIVDGMWIFRMKRPPGSPPAFKCDYELHSLYFSTTLLQGSLHEEIWLRSPPGFNESFLAGTQWSLWRPVYSLHKAPRKWHDTLRTTLAAHGFASTDLSMFLRTDTSLPPFYVLVYVDDLVFVIADTEALTLVKSVLQKRHTCTDLGFQHFGFHFSSPQPTPLSTSLSLSAPPSDESVEPSGPYPEIVGCLMHRKVYWDAVKRVLHWGSCLCSMLGMGLVLQGRGPVVFTGHADASWVDDSATQRSSQGSTFSLGSGSVSWRSTRSSSVLNSSCEAEIYAGAMAAQELRWLTYLLTDLGEKPHSPPGLYVDNEAMVAICQEHRLEHKTKHIDLRYFLARELQKRGQLRLAYVATRTNTADIFTKALPPGDHQRFSSVVGLVPTLPHLLTA
ncbi:unnamed protein product [Closterium sp. NIES-53]